MRTSDRLKSAPCKLRVPAGSISQTTLENYRLRHRHVDAHVHSQPVGSEFCTHTLHTKLLSMHKEYRTCPSDMSSFTINESMVIDISSAFRRLEDVDNPDGCTKASRHKAFRRRMVPLFGAADYEPRQ